MIAILNERRLNLLNRISNPIKAKPNITPKPTPKMRLVVVYPSGPEIIYVVMKKTLRIIKKMRVKASETFITGLLTNEVVANNIKQQRIVLGALIFVDGSLSGTAVVFFLHLS
jgi:hypothetical protein